jgi:hypothetical protein
VTAQASDNLTRPENRRPEWMRLAVLCFVFAVVALGYHAFFLNTFDHWWFDDDPRNFGFVKTVANPLAFFIDPALAVRFSATSTVNPMLGVSIWLDSTLAYRNILFAQLHNVIILAATLALLFLVLRKWAVSLLATSTLLLVWLLSPATVVVSGWLAARHHLEGLTWSLGAILVAQKLARAEWREGVRSISLLLFLLGGAALFKETFAITVPLGVGLYLWHRERRTGALSCAALLLAYVGYRCWMVGFTARYHGPLLGPAGVAEFISRLPYILFGNAGGYVLLALALAPIILLYRRGELRARVVLYTVVVMASSLVVVYPGAFALHRDWLEPLTWIRIVFLLHTGLFMGAGYLISRVRTPILGYIAGAVAISVTAAGGFVTQKKWEILLNRYEAEGKYYLEHPDRLLYSEVPAAWYLDGIQMLYAIPARHHIIVGEQRPLAETLAGHQAIWRYSDGKFVSDPELFEQLMAKAGSSALSP